MADILIRSYKIPCVLLIKDDHCNQVHKISLKWIIKQIEWKISYGFITKFGKKSVSSFISMMYNEIYTMREEWIYTNFLVVSK